MVGTDGIGVDDVVLGLGHLLHFPIKLNRAISGFKGRLGKFGQPSFKAVSVQFVFFIHKPNVHMDSLALTAL